MKKNYIKKIILFLIIIHISTLLFSIEKGWTLNVRADVGGTLSTPSVSDETLQYLNPLATEMSGFLSGLLFGGEVSVGYVFDTSDVFNSTAFTGIYVQGFAGVGMGNMSQKISAEQGGIPIDIYMIVDYSPVVNFGVKAHGLFFDNKLYAGIGIGGKALLDYTPQYTLYSSEPSVVETEVGIVSVSDELLEKMNPLAFSTRVEFGYIIPMIPTMDFLIGFYTQLNLYRPGYISMPPSLEESAQTNRPGADEIPPSPLLDFTQPFDDYWLNSVDFGINLGIAFKL